MTSPTTASATTSWRRRRTGLRSATTTTTSQARMPKGTKDAASARKGTSCNAGMSRSSIKNRPTSAAPARTTRPSRRRVGEPPVPDVLPVPESPPLPEAPPLAGVPSVPDVTPVRIRRQP
ncbi:hypothetical protein BN13_1000009 [Nostocoides jenkinsii Ben 74]|uniref:Uncharacterized protein n=1 Tax=Nostocoides jenkinsii Ben 74 TaxID=1193518 RepID=A0A077M9R0_9MICO|nr:hypothetical protein BN13_1000009 [Tetrasphaera jenkinsii Ben 74]